MDKPRVVFFGTPEFACAILKTLYEENYPVAAAVSQPDKPVGRKHKIVPTPVHELADELGIPVIQHRIALGIALDRACVRGQRQDVARPDRIVDRESICGHQLRRRDAEGDGDRDDVVPFSDRIFHLCRFVRDFRPNCILIFFSLPRIVLLSVLVQR